jgi:hypothetical protein
MHPRMMCADLIETWWMDESGHRQEAVANLEDISSSGVCLQLDAPVAHGLLMHIHHDEMEFVGRVRYCVFRDTGYFLGVEFEEGFEWDQQLFRPKHLLDPRSLIGLEPKAQPRKRTAPGSGRIQ